MAPFGKIYSYPNNPRVQRVQALAAMNGLEVETVADFQMGVTNQTPEFLAKFPLGKVPAFESADGTFFLTESQAIARYVAESGPRADELLGRDPRERALIEQWACFAEQELVGNMLPAVLMCVAKFWPFDQAAYDRSLSVLERAVKRVDVALQGGAPGKKFLVGDRLTFADVMVVGALHIAAKYVVDADMRKEAPAVEPYVRAVLEVPEMKQYFGELELCETRVGKPE
ncbi:glutathione S-transferase-like protein [Chaetomium strumarium]|uniref:Glutathione S-transferase-like protein n=1 Tax=Chaetomium strumarium TaxID=1170767 RepID=A0AAJ0GU26_9PEZI|nr:glutathione S-transferase-like protein [Chaetomium strumarium]